MKRIVVADAGPLIGLARVNQLDLLEKLYHQITIAPRVLEELKLSSEKPGATIISAANDAGWLRVSQLKKKDECFRLKQKERVFDISTLKVESIK